MTAVVAGVPRFVERGARPYVARRAAATTATPPEIADRIPEVLAWLDGRAITPSGLGGSEIDSAR